MRGRHRSRPPVSVLSEIRALVAEGVKEINLISQDTTYYGMDLWAAKAGPRQPVDSSRGPTLAALLREIQEIDGDFWVRLLYTHPAHWSSELIETIAECDKVARYIDMPLQHIDETMLGRMRRETSRAHIEDLIDELRAGIPGLALRTTFIVGFPGETEEAFESLLEFIERTRFERLGVFKYSQEDGSRAAKMPEQLSGRIKNQRFRRAMTVQQRIAREMAEEKVGRELRLLVDQPLVARTAEDTRHSGNLLRHFEIRKPLLSYHEHNEAMRADQLAERLAAGENVALITDAGMPGLSDPGARLIRKCIERDLPYTIVPGVSAILTALVGSGISMEQFCFRGFLPVKSGQRERELRTAAEREETSIFFESPYRILKTLAVCAEMMPDRQLCVARELTKKFEEFRRGTAAELLAHYETHPAKGEITVVISGRE